MKPANAQNGKGLSPLPAPILRFSVTIRKTFQNLKEPPCAATEERPSRGIRRVALGRIGKLVLVLVGDRPDEYEACIKLARHTIQVAGYIVSAGAGFSHSRYDVDISGIPSHTLYKVSSMVVNEDEV
ncbi:hypothetical protein H0G86_001097 [Trichoderma simmonsii]|uniref:Uncharacterized protein n=1 Tax=Trichoderma simmonsii TaxID=1491479 RepID=A0A8G0L0X3_9HYPO|nr:hypothetical protein H0G86_001097 [Trichoderma simmonsii]